MRLRHVVPLGLAALVLGTAACGSSSTPTSTAATAGPTNVSVTLVAGKGCDPASFAVAPGAVHFDITNSSGASAEFEVVSSKPTIVGEVEKIADGTTAVLDVDLDPGTYDLICAGHLRLRNALVVTEDPTTATTLGTADLASAVAAYSTYVDAQVASTVADTRALETAVATGALGASKQAYEASRLGWERVEPVAELFPEFDGSMDSRVDDFPGGETDPDFTGWHRIEYELYVKGDPAAAMPFATKLASDAVALQAELAKIDIDPSTMVNGAAGLIEEASSTKVSGEEDRYSQLSLVDLAANVEGAQKIVELLTPELQAANPALVATLTEDFTRFDATLAPFATDLGYTPYDQVPEAAKARFKADLAQLSEDLSTMAGALGLEVK